MAKTSDALRDAAQEALEFMESEFGLCGHVVDAHQRPQCPQCRLREALNGPCVSCEVRKLADYADTRVKESDEVAVREVHRDYYRRFKRIIAKAIIGGRPANPCANCGPRQVERGLGEGDD